MYTRPVRMENSTQTVTVQTGTSQTHQPPVQSVHITLEPAERRHVSFAEGVVDNEHMGKKKSKCCCIYKKPHSFGESSSDESDDDCEHCRGHKDKCYRKQPGSGHGGPTDQSSSSDPSGSTAGAGSAGDGRVVKT